MICGNVEIKNVLNGLNDTMKENSGQSVERATWPLLYAFDQTWVEKDELKNKLFSLWMEFGANVMAPGQSFHPEKCSQSNKEPHGKNKVQGTVRKTWPEGKDEAKCVNPSPFLLRLQTGSR